MHVIIIEGDSNVIRGVYRALNWFLSMKLPFAEQLQQTKSVMEEVFAPEPGTPIVFTIQRPVFAMNVKLSKVLQLQNHRAM